MLKQIVADCCLSFNVAVYTVLLFALVCGYLPNSISVHFTTSLPAEQYRYLQSICSSKSQDFMPRLSFW